QLAVVNAVPEDKLLAGLVPAEMAASSPPEALKAQAVAARNELLAKIGTRHLTDPYRLCSAQHCQVYAGAGREDPRATAAVTATRLPTVARIGDDELKAWLAIGPSSDGSGAWCARPKEAQINFRWQKAIDVAALQARAGVGPLKDLRVEERGPKRACASPATQ